MIKVEHYFYFPEMKTFTGVVVDEHGYQASYVNGLLHSEDGSPTVIGRDGKYRAWYQRGRLHNTSGPAIIWHRYLAYYEDGLRSSRLGPAVTYEDGSKEFWLQGKMFKDVSDNSAWRIYVKAQV